MLEVVTPATDRKLAKLDDFKSDLGIADNSKDADLTRILEEASDIVRSWCGREFVRETVKETLDHLGGHMILLTRTPVWSISSIKYDGVSVSTSDVLIDDSRAGIIFRKHPFTDTTFVSLWLRPYPFHYGARYWEITYDAGYDPPSGSVQDHPMPRDIQRATLEIARSIWLERSVNPNIRSIKVGEASETRETSSGFVGFRAEKLLEPWRRIAT